MPYVSSPSVNDTDTIEDLLRNWTEKKRDLGEKNPATRTALELLLEKHRREGNWGEVVSLTREFLEIEKDCSCSTEGILAIQEDLATAYLNDGNLAESETQILEVVENRKRSNGMNRDTLNSIGILEWVYLRQHKFDELVELLSSKMEDQIRVYGANDRDTQMDILIWILSLMHLERWEEAERVSSDNDGVGSREAFARRDHSLMEDFVRVWAEAAEVQHYFA